MKRFKVRSGMMLALCIVMLLPAVLLSQKQIQEDNQLWFAYFNQTRFTDHWGVWTDLHLRTRDDFVNDLAIGIARIGLTYYVHDHTKLTAGYAFINHFPTVGHEFISQPEHRPWQQIQWHSRFPKLRTMQWLRLEERFRRKIQNDDTLAEGYLFNFRTRYNFLLQFPLSSRAFQPGTFSFVLNDEVHLNFGDEIVYNTFDQNRLFLGFNFHLNAHDNVQFGYMNVFQQTASGNKYHSNHILRLFFFHNLDFREKE